MQKKNGKKNLILIQYCFLTKEAMFSFKKIEILVSEYSD